MTYLLLDDGFTENPKIDSLSDKAFRLHVAGLCYCARNLTDGLVPRERVKRLLIRVANTTVSELIERGCWRETADGYEVIGFLDWNPSKEKVEKRRADAAARKEKWAEERESGNASRNAFGTRRENASLSNPIQSDPITPSPPSLAPDLEAALTTTATREADGYPDIRNRPAWIKARVVTLGKDLAEAWPDPARQLVEAKRLAGVRLQVIPGGVCSQEGCVNGWISMEQDGRYSEAVECPKCAAA